MQAKPLAIYGVQLILNFAWNPIFFQTKRLDFALGDSCALLGATIATTAAFAKVDRNAALLMAPSIPWVAYATALTYVIRKRNPEAHKIKVDIQDDGTVKLNAPN